MNGKRLIMKRVNKADITSGRPKLMLVKSKNHHIPLGIVLSEFFIKSGVAQLGQKSQRSENRSVTSAVIMVRNTPLITALEKIHVRIGLKANHILSTYQYHKCDKSPHKVK